MGVNPRHKDLLVEIDWSDDALGCVAHSHRPAPDQIAEVQIFFANAPVPNPDGTQGVNFIADFGQGGHFTGGNFIDIPDGITSPLGAPFYERKQVHFAPNRRGFFRYQIHAHRWAPGNDSSGWGLVSGDDAVVTLNCKLTLPGYVRNTIIHELGHNLGLQHGGDIHCNGKLNYNSLMNYNHQFSGLDISCDYSGDGVDNLGYSDGTRNALVQGHLDEAAGICPMSHPQHTPIDWNSNGQVDVGPVSYPGNFSFECAALTKSTDFNDYAALTVAPRTPQNGGAPTPGGESGACPPPPNM